MTEIRVINRNRLRYGQHGTLIRKVEPVAYYVVKFADSPDEHRLEEGDFEEVNQPVQDHDDIFESDCDALVNATNTQGVMGGGIAKGFADRFPEMLADYKRACRVGEHTIGRCHYFPEGDKVIVNFPTMTYPGQRAHLEDIEAGLLDLRVALAILSDPELANPTISSIAIPGLGCGIGRLEWDDVEKLIRKYLGDIEGLRVELYPPNGRKYEL
jgi:O-acetyl-ADP-ribose deacetylase (regulator of RNase III)